MNVLLVIAEQLLINSVLSGGAPFSSKSKVGFGLMVLSGLLLFLSFIFLIFGGYLWLSENYGSDMAAFMVGGAVLVLSLIVAGASVAILKHRERHYNAMTDAFVKTMQSVLNVAEGEVEVAVEKNPKASVAIASAAGFLLGRKIL